MRWQEVLVIRVKPDITEVDTFRRQVPDLVRQWSELNNKRCGWDESHSGKTPGDMSG